jgi:hypothetical protein
MIFESKYDSRLVIFTTLLGFLPGSVIMTIFGYRFFFWYKSNTKEFTPLFYGIAGIMVAISLICNAIAFNGIIIANEASKGYQISAKNQQVQFPEISNQRFGNLTAFYLVGFVVLIPAFICAWSGAAMQLNHYSKSIGKYRYWALISLPLIIYIIGLLPTFATLPANRLAFYDPDLIIFRLFFKSTIIVGSIIFSIAFLSIGRATRHKNCSKNMVATYMTCSAFGVAMLTNLVATPVYHTTYPPFGLSASSYIAFSAFLLSLGFYSSALSLSQDTKLRASIRKSTMEEHSKLAWQQHKCSRKYKKKY